MALLLRMFGNTETLPNSFLQAMVLSGPALRSLEL